MNTQNNPASSDGELDEVLEIINALARKSASANYIYRGETRDYGKVSSSLYREYPDELYIEAIQEEYLNEAELYTQETDRFAILAELQHYGGNTNLIDFTTDYLIALFFACDGDHTQDGRVVLLSPSGDMEEHIHEPQSPARRVLAQKSIFVRPPAGYVEPDDNVAIPRHLKVHILGYLQNGHGISTNTIYNDLLGFIRSRAIHRKAFEHFTAAVSYNANNDYTSAIKECNRALNFNPQITAAYRTRGIAYAQNGDIERAITDFNRVLGLAPEDIGTLCSRGIAYYDKGDHDRAIADFDRAIELNPNYALAYIGRGSSHIVGGDYDQAVEDFSRAIEMEPGHANAYSGLGLSYFKKGDYDSAVENYDRAIELDSGRADFYCNLGEAWLHLSDWEKARENLMAAREMGADIIASFRNDYENIAAFKQKTNLTVPDDIVEMLGG